MIRCFKPSCAWLLMAAMALCTSSCSDDEEKNMADPEPTAEELAGMAAADRYEAANFVIRAFAGLDELPDNWETSTFTPTEGVVVDEAAPGVRYVIVENQEAAERYFFNLTPDATREETADGYRLVVEGFGTLAFRRMNSATCFGVVTVNLPQMPTLTEIRLVPESEVPTNAKYDGKPYYGIGSLVREKSTKRLYICVRPSGGPNRKEYAYFVSFDPQTITTTTKKMTLYELDAMGRKSKESASTSGDWTFAKNLVEKRIALAAAMAFAQITTSNEMSEVSDFKRLLYEVYKAYQEHGIQIPQSHEFFIPYGSYKSSSAGSNRQAKYEQPGLCWAWMKQLGLRQNVSKQYERAVSYVRLRPDAKSHLLTLTDAYDPSYYSNWSKAVDAKDDFVLWGPPKVGYKKCFNILDYQLNGESTKRFYPKLADLNYWGDPEHAVPVLLMTQKKITDKGQASSKFEDVKIVNHELKQEWGPTLDVYKTMWEHLEYYELIDGRITSYDEDDKKSMSQNPDI
ncbi:MAG: hypothetical protein ACI38V_07800 [Bacteroides sp.]